MKMHQWEDIEKVRLLNLVRMLVKYRDRININGIPTGTGNFTAEFLHTVLCIPLARQTPETSRHFCIPKKNAYERMTLYGVDEMRWFLFK
jgi:hypothetical protein